MKEFLLSNQNKAERNLLYLLILFLPTQLGRHFWPDFTSVAGIRIDYLSPTIYFTDILVLLLFSVWVFGKIKWKKVKAPKRQKLVVSSKKSAVRNQQSVSAKVIPLFACVLLIGIFTSGYITGGLYKALKLLEMSFVAYYIAKFIAEKKVFEKLISLFCLTVIFQSLLAIAQYYQHGSIGGVLYFLGERYFNASTPGIANASLAGELILRPYGTFPHPNVLAGYLLLVMTLIIYSIHKIEAPIVKRLKIISLLLGTTAIFLTMSRVAIALWVAVAIYYFLSHSKKRWPVFVIVGCLIAFFASPLGARFTKINIADEAIVQRKILIESSVNLIKTNPYFGVGLGNFLPHLPKVQNPLSLGLYLQPVHNIFLLTFAEIGIFGFSIFVWFLWKTFGHLKRHKEKALIIVLSQVMILGLFDHYFLTLQQGQLLFAFILGLCFVSPKIFPSARVEKF